MSNEEELLSLPQCFETRIRKSVSGDFVILSQPKNDDEDSEVWLTPFQVDAVIAALRQFLDTRK